MKLKLNIDFFKFLEIFIIIVGVIGGYSVLRAEVYNLKENSIPRGEIIQLIDNKQIQIDEVEECVKKIEIDVREIKSLLMTMSKKN